MTVNDVVNKFICITLQENWSNYQKPDLNQSIMEMYYSGLSIYNVGHVYFFVKKFVIIDLIR